MLLLSSEFCTAAYSAAATTDLKIDLSACPGFLKSKSASAKPKVGLGLSRVRELELLSAFDSAAIQSQDIHRDFKLLSVGTYRISGVSGIRYAVRFDPVSGRGEFERFGSQIVNSGPGVRTPRIRLLNPEQGKQLLDTILESSPEAKEGLEEMAKEFDGVHGARLFAHARQNPEITVAVYFEGLTEGEEFLKSNLASDPLHIFWSDVGQSGLGLTSRKLSDFKKAITPVQLAQFTVDVKSIFPDLPITSSNAIQYLDDHYKEMLRTAIAGLDTIGLDRLPPAVQTQLSDHAAMWDFAGIPDFHPNNWLTDGQSVLSLDLAMMTYWFTKGQPEIEMDYQSLPFGQTIRPSPRMRQFIYRHVSDKMRQYLKSVDLKVVNELATQAKYPLTQIEASGMIARAHGFASAVNQARADPN